MKFTGPYRLRLTVGLPLVVVCFTLAAGFLPLGMIAYSLGRVERPFDLRNLILNLRVTVLVIAIVATVLSVMVSRYIVGPIEKLIEEMEAVAARNRNESNGDRQENRQTNDEIDRLSRLYKETFVPMKGYLTTADLFLQMSEGIVSLDHEGKVAFLNAPMERLLGISREK